MRNLFTPFHRSLTRMSSHKLCMIPGPIEFHSTVLDAMSTPATSHVAPTFINVFGETIEMMRRIVLTKDGQPFIVSGSGTLGWDMTAANLIEAGDRVLVINTGYFGDSFGECLETYGAVVQHVRCEVGGRPTVEHVTSVLKQDGPFKAVTITHVDTSTGVLNDIQALAGVIKTTHPDTLVVVDGVCSVASEELRFDEWKVDVVLTASQKALGAPPGLSILVASQHAMNIFQTRQSPISSYYASWKRWLPIMQAYESRKPSYFGTPAVQNIMALHVSLGRILQHSMDDVFKRHREVNARIKAHLTDKLGLRLVPLSLEMASNSLSAVYYPEGVVPSTLLSSMGEQGVVIAGGLHRAIATKYFRIGHMGITVMDDEALGYVAKTLAALDTALDNQLGVREKL
jgi:alanine-glyoxylate transaminase/serine-glyoxylate transaminase/serine-pyruvate transaminase